MKTKLSAYLFFTGIILSCAGLAHASTSFGYTGSNISPSSSSIVESLGGITATATGVWVNANNSGSTVSGATNDLSTTWLGEYSGNGIGTCNPNEQSACSSPQHQIDNLNGLDFVLFGFSTSVSLTNVQVASYGNPSGSGSDDVDLSYAILTSAQEAALVAGTLVFNTVNFTTLSTGDLSSNTYSLAGTGQYVLIGTAVTAYYGDGSSAAATPDAFKIQDLTVSATPEPASFLLIGSGLLAGAVFGRKLRKK